MKICFLAASNSIHSYKWVNYFHEIGHDVTWISLSPTIFDIPEGIRFIEIQQHSMRLELISAVVKIRKLLAQNQTRSPACSLCWIIWAVRALVRSGSGCGYPVGV